MGVGAFAERIAVPPTILAPLPDDLSFVEGSTLPVCTLTGRLLVDAAAVKKGDLVLVTGPRGMVGGFAAQLATGWAPLASPACVTPTLARHAGWCGTFTDVMRSRGVTMSGDCGRCRTAPARGWSRRLLHDPVCSRRRSHATNR
jgi:hypothetical protein